MKLDIYKFGRHLLETNDLDPIYVALDEMLQNDVIDTNQLKRWLVSYWCFYHAGVASYLSELEGTAYWEAFRIAAENIEPAPVGGRWPRGKERRHFRAANAMKSYADLSSRYPNPEAMVDYIVYGNETTLPAGSIPYKTIAKRAQEHSGFGPWIGFKIADMIDRVLGVQVDFQNTEVFIFKDPKQAALMYWEANGGKPDTPEMQILIAVSSLLIGHFSDVKAPPFRDRPVNIQEVETILCKWKSHQRGHYPLLNDITDIQEGITDWCAICPTAEAFKTAMPKGDKA